MPTFYPVEYLGRLHAYYFKKTVKGYRIMMNGIPVGYVEKYEDFWKSFTQDGGDLIYNGAGDTRREAVEDLLKYHVFPFKEGRVGWAKENQ